MWLIVDVYNAEGGILKDWDSKPVAEYLLESDQLVDTLDRVHINALLSWADGFLYEFPETVTIEAVKMGLVPHSWVDQDISIRWDQYEVTEAEITEYLKGRAERGIPDHGTVT